MKTEYQRARRQLKRIIRTFQATDIDWCLDRLFQECTFHILGDYPRVRETLGSWTLSYMRRING